MYHRPTSNPPEFPGIFAMLGAIMQRPGNAVSASSARRWCASWAGAGIVLMVLCLAVYRPGLKSIPPVDRDESRFAQASRTMLETRDFVVPRIQDTPRLNKPPLIYWLQAGSAYLLGDAPGADGLGEWRNGNIYVFRIPSVLCAIGTVLLTWRFGLRLFDPRAAALAAALLAVCPMVVWDAHQARADQLLLFTTTCTMFALFVCWKNSHRHTHTSPPHPLTSSPPHSPTPSLRHFVTSSLPPIFFWTFLAFGILAKGPITPLIAALTIITLCISTRSLRWLLHLRPFLGLLILAVLVGPWVYAVIQRVGWSTYWPIILKETIGRSTDAAENHWGPPGYHTVLLAVLFWPGSLLTLAAVLRAIKRVWNSSIRTSWPRSGHPSRPQSGPSSLPWASAHGTATPDTQTPAGRHSSAPQHHPSPNPTLFLLAWLLPSWLLFECIATKLPHYTMPLYPAIALLTARAACAAMAPGSTLLRSAFDRIGVFLWGGIGVVGLLGSLAALTEWGGYDFASLPVGRSPQVIAAIAILAWIIGACIAVVRRRAIILAHALAIGAMLIWCWVLLAWVLPLSHNLWISPRIAAAVSRHQTTAAAPVALVGYHEDSAIFMFRGRADRIEPAQLADWIKRNPAGCVAVEPARAPGAAALAATLLTRVSTIDGYNYSIGKRATVDVYAPRPLPLTNP